MLMKSLERGFNCDSALWCRTGSMEGWFLFRIQGSMHGPQAISTAILRLR